MKLITPDAMRAAEQALFTREDSFAVMDRAALAVARITRDFLRNGAAAVLCGPGNNGGDGYGCAAHLLRMGCRAQVYALGEPRGDALREKQVYEALGGSTLPLQAMDLSGVTVVVDALLGIGFSRAPEGELAAAVRRVNASGIRVVSVDIPTGAEALDGRVPGEAVRADDTVTFGFAKPGHFRYPARSYVGTLHIVPLGLEEEADPRIWQTLTPKDAAVLLPRRDVMAHKGDFGTVLCAAGSLGMAGAGSLASEATLRSGCGKTTWLYPGQCNGQPAREVMAMPLGERYFRPGDVDAVLEYLQRSDVLALGPGLGRRAETFHFVKRLMAQVHCPFVMDADALMAYAARADKICGRGRGILTPHAGEAAALLGISVGQVLQDTAAAARQISLLSGCVTVLKGASTLISDGKRWCINTTGNPGMATAGSGDVLTGILAGLLAQGMDGFEAACLGVYVHGLAGDLCAGEGGRGMLAGDMLPWVRTALARLENESQS